MILKVTSKEPGITAITVTRRNIRKIRMIIREQKTRMVILHLIQMVKIQIQITKRQRLRPVIILLML